jgi:hypothetical protein
MPLSTRETHLIIDKIAERSASGAIGALAIAKVLGAVNKRTPLNLERLYDFNVFNFTHDIKGIIEHANPKTGNLLDHFSPRCGFR